MPIWHSDLAGHGGRAGRVWRKSSRPARNVVGLMIFLLAFVLGHPPEASQNLSNTRLTKKK